MVTNGDNLISSRWRQSCLCECIPCLPSLCNDNGWSVSLCCDTLSLPRLMRDKIKRRDYTITPMIEWSSKESLLPSTESSSSTTLQSKIQSIRSRLVHSRSNPSSISKCRHDGMHSDQEIRYSSRQYSSTQSPTGQ